MEFWVLPRHFEDRGLENTQTYDPYENEMQNEQTFSQLAQEIEPMPEMGDNYIGAEIMLPRGVKMARGHEVVWSCNANGKVMDKAHENPIMDKRIYQAEFAVGKITE